MNTPIKYIGWHTLGISIVICACLVALNGWRGESDSTELDHLPENTRVRTDHRSQDAETSNSPNISFTRRDDHEATGFVSDNPSEQIEPNTRTKHRSAGLPEGNKAEVNPISLIERHALSKSKSVGENQAADLQTEQTAHSHAAPYPASFAELPKEHSFTDAQVEKMDELANQFVEDLGGADQDPADPAYVDRWIKSTPVNDSNYKFWFGRVAYVQQQLRAASAAQTTSTESNSK